MGQIYQFLGRVYRFLGQVLLATSSRVEILRQLIVGVAVNPAVDASNARSRDGIASKELIPDQFKRKKNQPQCSYFHGSQCSMFKCSGKPGCERGAEGQRGRADLPGVEIQQQEKGI